MEITIKNLNLFETWTYLEKNIVKKFLGFKTKKNALQKKSQRAEELETP